MNSMPGGFRPGRNLAIQRIGGLILILSDKQCIDLCPELQMNAQQFIGDFFKLGSRSQSREISNRFPHLQSHLERIRFFTCHVTVSQRAGPEMP